MGLEVMGVEVTEHTLWIPVVRIAPLGAHPHTHTAL